MVFRSKPIVAVIGGGQLARMMAPAASELDIDLRVLIEEKDSSADQVFANTTVGAANDERAVLKFAAGADVVTFEHEHTPQKVIDALLKKGIDVQPNPKALLFAQNKLEMRQLCAKLKLSQPDWAEVKDVEDAIAFLREHAGAAILKQPVGGYDGKGVAVIRLFEGEKASPEGELKSAEQTLLEEWLVSSKTGTLLIEELVDFKGEISALLARSTTGEIASWPVVDILSQDSVCKAVVAPAAELYKFDLRGRAVPSKLARDAAAAAVKVAETIKVVGVLAVEMFETKDGRYLINEFAMRPHNTGHWTIDGAVTSQFEQHLRAVLGLPLGSTDLLAPRSVMVNILGSVRKSLSLVLPSALKLNPRAKINLYGKSIRPGRKLGHVNLTAPTSDTRTLNAAKRDAFEIARLFQGE